MIIDRVAVWSALAGTVSAVTTVGGLFFVWLQLRANRSVMLANLDAQVYTRLDTINQLLLEHPEIEEDLQNTFDPNFHKAADPKKNLADMIFTVFWHARSFVPVEELV